MVSITVRAAISQARHKVNFIYKSPLHKPKMQIFEQICYLGPILDPEPVYSLIYAAADGYYSFVSNVNSWRSHLLIFQYFK